MKSNNRTKFYVRSGNAFDNEPYITASSAKEAAIGSTERIIRYLAKIAEESSNNVNLNINQEASKFTFAKKILVSETGFEKLNEFVEDLKSRLGLPEEEIASLSEEWKKNHENDVFFDFEEIKKIAIGRVLKELQDNKNKDAYPDSDEEGFDSLEGL